jgi:hypothetical protein
LIWGKGSWFCVVQKVSLLLPGQVTDVPADAVHRQDAFLGIGLGETLEAAHELPPGEAEL